MGPPRMEERAEHGGGAAGWGAPNGRMDQREERGRSGGGSRRKRRKTRDERQRAMRCAMALKGVLERGGRPASGTAAREGLFLSQEGRGRFNNELTCSQSYPWTSARELWRAGAPSSPRFASPLQPKTTFPKISERTLWTLGAAGGLLAAGPGGLGARESRLDSGRDPRPPAPIAALSRCAFRALSVPSDRNRSPRGRLRGWYLGRSGSGEAVEALRRSDGIHQGTRDRS